MTQTVFYKSRRKWEAQWVLYAKLIKFSFTKFPLQKRLNTKTIKNAVCVTWYLRNAWHILSPQICKLSVILALFDSRFLIRVLRIEEGDRRTISYKFPLRAPSGQLGTLERYRFRYPKYRRALARFQHRWEEVSNPRTWKLISRVLIEQVKRLESLACRT